MANKYGKYHTTLSRRDFMKMLGLSGAAIGAVTAMPAATPILFHDLDETMASPEADWKRPSWIKETERPTVDIDWQMMGRFDYGEVMFARGFEKAMGAPYVRWATEVGQRNKAQWIRQGRPGFTLRDHAIRYATQPFAFKSHSFIGHKLAPTPQDLGVPRWEGTPEENSRMLRSAMRLFGADQVSFVELDSDTTEKLIYSYDIDGKRIDIKHVSYPEEQQDCRIIPKKARWVIIYTVKMSYELVHRLPSWSAGATVYNGYAMGPFVQERTQEFLRGLGYMCLGEIRPNAIGTSVGFGILAGIGEMSRVEHLITPERGLSHRVFKLITDLPLMPGKPIDSGVMQFCRTCKKCAELCPANAIPRATDPSWEIPGPYKRPGVRGWSRIEPLCYSYWRQTDTGCGFCLAVCPLNKPGSTAYFNAMRGVASKTSAINPLFRNIDDAIGYGVRTEYEDFWNLEMPTMGWD